MDPITQILVGLTAAIQTAALLAKAIAEYQQTGRVPTQAEIDAATQSAMAAHANLDSALDGSTPSPTGE